MKSMDRRENICKCALSGLRDSIDPVLCSVVLSRNSRWYPEHPRILFKIHEDIRCADRVLAHVSQKVQAGTQICLLEDTHPAYPALWKTQLCAHGLPRRRFPGSPRGHSLNCLDGATGHAQTVPGEFSSRAQERLIQTWRGKHVIGHHTVPREVPSRPRTHTIQFCEGGSNWAREYSSGRDPPENPEASHSSLRRRTSGSGRPQNTHVERSPDGNRASRECNSARDSMARTAQISHHGAFAARRPPPPLKTTVHATTSQTSYLLAVETDAVCHVSCPMPAAALHGSPSLLLVTVGSSGAGRCAAPLSRT